MSTRDDDTNPAGEPLLPPGAWAKLEQPGSSPLRHPNEDGLVAGVPEDESIDLIESFKTELLNQWPSS